MDAHVSAPQVARTLGVSLPTAHRVLDAAGIPRTGRGRPRAMPSRLLDDVLAARGAVPSAPLPRTQLRVLAALSRAPLGLPSARSVATRAGVSPTTASTGLQRLRDAGLVTRREHVIARGSAVAEWRWEPVIEAWPSSLRSAVRATRLPRQQRAAVPLPRALRHLFWNADFAELDPRRDGSYLAERLLTAPDANAWAWALTNLGRGDVETALGRRGIDARTKALVRNWYAHE
ncbi:MAG: hypothetical protein DI534_11990 [Leifsonia xyli]|nr:MAG: hypothetical protein DI534_11990 [Leifsonia xyli]